MIKILIVDDEYYFRQGFKVLLPYEDMGFIICGEAKNGEEALEKIETLQPDIVFVDINMPLIDGLEFLKLVRQKNLNTFFVLLTGYSEFSYAKKAMQLGAFNYLLKPVNIDELKQTLVSLKERVEKNTNYHIEMDLLRKQVEKSRPILRDRFLYNLVKGGAFNRQTYEQKISCYGIDLIGDQYAVVLLEIDGQNRWREEDRQLWRFAVANIASEILTDHGVHSVYLELDGMICFLLSATGKNGIVPQRLFALCDQIRKTISFHLEFTVTIGMGEVKEDPSEIPISYEEAQFALCNKLTLGADTVIPWADVKETPMLRYPYHIGRRSDLLLSLRLGDEARVSAIIDSILQEFSNKNVNLNILLATCVEIISTVFEFLAEAGQDIGKLFAQRSHLIEDLQAQSSLAEIKSWLSDFVTHALSTVKNKHGKEATNLVQSVLQYVNDNFSSPELSIDEIAKKFFVSYGHLCFIFKRETGATMNEYISDVRLGKAKELIDGGNTHIYDVAEKVGFSDQGYFSKCFKKAFGVVPSQYVDHKIV